MSIINQEFTSSDGTQFSYFIRKMNLKEYCVFEQVREKGDTCDIICTLLASCICDEKGTSIYKKADIETWEPTKAMTVFNKLFEYNEYKTKESFLAQEA